MGTCMRTQAPEFKLLSPWGKWRWSWIVFIAIRHKIQQGSVQLIQVIHNQMNGAIV
jgi:hypothetical protein